MSRDRQNSLWVISGSRVTPALCPFFPPKQTFVSASDTSAVITDDDLTAINGHRDQLEGKIRERYGLSRDQARKEIDDWYGSQSALDWPDLASPNYKFTRDELNEAPPIRPQDIDVI